MKIVSMVQEPKEAEKPATAPSVDQPRFPYGLCIRLDEQSIKKLGWKDLPKAKTPVTIEAKGVVVSTRISEGAEYSSMGVEIQITHLGVDAGTQKASDTLYPDGGKKSLKGE